MDRVFQPSMLLICIHMPTCNVDGLRLRLQPAAHGAASPYSCISPSCPNFPTSFKHCSTQQAAPPGSCMLMIFPSNNLSGHKHCQQPHVLCFVAMCGASKSLRAACCQSFIYKMSTVEMQTFLKLSSVPAVSSPRCFPVVLNALSSATWHPCVDAMTQP